MPTALAIERLDPASALPGAEVHLRGQFASAAVLPQVRISGAAAPLLLYAPRLLITRVPDAAVSGTVEVANATLKATASMPLEVAVMIAENLHPVCNPVLDASGDIFVTMSGSRGQKTPVSIFKLDANYALKAWSSAITNPSGLAFDSAGTLFASSRYNGTIYRLDPGGTPEVFSQGLGVATGIAFDHHGDLYVGDRSGTVFKIDRQGQTFVFATLEPSVAAYHLAFGPDRFLYVSAPTTSSHDTIWKISTAGEVRPHFRGLGRPQGLAFDGAGALYVIASFRGRRGVIRIVDGQASCVVSGNNLVGLAFAPGSPGAGHPALILATHHALFNLAWTRPAPPSL
ncbi:MAG: gluconolaconase [Terriglobales bacterium]